MIPVFVASSERFAEVEWLAPFSISENTDSAVAVHVVHPAALGMPEEGCTGFTMLRYAVPHWCRQQGYDAAIYLDVDMLVLRDIAELWAYAKRDRWVSLLDGSDEVSVIGADVAVPPISEIRRDRRHAIHVSKSPEIPLSWNCEDAVPRGANILHFTDLKTQPWWHEHPNPAAVSVYESCHRRYRAQLDALGDRAG